MIQRFIRAAAGLVATILLVARVSALPLTNDYFAISVVDEETGRGVPLVELKTVNHISYYTDSNGLIAFYEPGLMGQTVFFHIKSHGYEFRKDGFGNRGQALKPVPGGSAQLKIKRVNIAERLYRITGEGTYRDSVLLGRPVPIQQPLINGQVMGQDSVMALPYRGKLYWFWGDTDKPGYPLGHFGTAGATSELPGQGGLDPGVGIDLHYFVDGSGFSRPMCNFPETGPKWTFGVMTLRDSQGAERLLARCDRVKNVGEVYERMLVGFNDQTASFERLGMFSASSPLYPEGQPFRVRVKGEEYCYFPTWAPQPCVRVKADFAHVTNSSLYEAFTCLAPGSRYEKAASRLERAGDGRPVYSWKTNTDYITHERQRELVSTGRLKADEGWLQMRDIVTGESVHGHSGSVCWNEFRHRWIMIAQRGAGEIWYTEADSPIGPWVYARKIVAHDRYNFYNPVQHPFFDQQGGRWIYFEGTYTDAFSSAPAPTPRYNYNQIMYRLRLDDPRLFLPVPVYRVKDSKGVTVYLTAEAVSAQDAWDRVEDVAFFALPPQRALEGATPICAAVEGGNSLLRCVTVGEGAEPAFCAAPDSLKDSPSVIALYEYIRPGGARFYTTAADLNEGAARQAATPLCRVWRNPGALLILDRWARPGQTLGK